MAQHFGLKIDADFEKFVNEECLNGLDVTPDQFWEGFAGIVNTFGPRGRDMLAIREDLQSKIDAWHGAHPGSMAGYQDFLREIGYLVPEGEDFQIETTGIDAEVGQICGPQLVVPIMNARFALNAANARWGSLYDGFYGTDALGSLPPKGGFDNDRGDQVIAKARVFLDHAVPLDGISHADVTRYSIKGGTLDADGHGLADAAGFVGHMGAADAPATIVLKNNNLHVLIDIDAAHMIGKRDNAGVSDVRLEAAVSAIMDCEDSVAAVDAEDKIVAYRNWLGLMRGDLVEEFNRGGKTISRKLADDLTYSGADGVEATLKGRALMFVRNVGHLMTNPTILDSEGREVGEGLMDALMTTMIAMHDFARDGGNSLHGSVYIVKPKMHGPDEVALTNDIFAAVEDVLGLPRYTVKLGIMDEERRTSANLKECIRAAKHRVAFINTGFLDRTGDEIHTSMNAGVMTPKAQMKTSSWLMAYEDRNVDIGLACGLSGRAQIGKGMWAVPDQMGEMLMQKVGHPMAGANCAWVPSPTAAVLHAMHYHQVDVFARQAEIAAGGPRGTLNDLLTVPLVDPATLNAAQIEAEMDNCAQGILGYVVRWVDQGIGCSKVPDINNIGQMEDRATCRISAQMMANWMHQGVVDEAAIMASLRKMAEVVDGQNADDPLYQRMGGGSNSLAFQAVRDLVLEGVSQPSGYTEPLLHAYRARVKSQAG
jgi:malate synthase